MASLELLLRTEFTDARQDLDEIFLTEDQWREALRRIGADPVLCLPVAGQPLVAESGMRVFAARVKADRVPLAVPDLLAHLGQRLPDYMLPGHIQVVDALPLSSNGKIDYRLLRSWLPRVDQATVGPDEDVSEQEGVLARVWPQVLVLQHVGRIRASSSWAATRCSPRGWPAGSGRSWR